MKEAFGFWLLDVSKYVTTAILLGTLFAGEKQGIIYVGGVTIALVTLLIGVRLTKKEEKNG
jgi:hypothetical protein